MVTEKIIEAIQKAEAEALKQGIETNTVILNSEFDFCKEFWNLEIAKNMIFLALLKYWMNLIDLV